MSAHDPIRVLILEDTLADAELMVRALRRAGIEPRWQQVDGEDDFLAGLTPEPDLILSDYTVPGFDGLQALRLVRSRGLDVPFILVSGSIGEDLAVAAMRGGADDYLLKDRMTRLGAASLHALERRDLRRQSERAQRALRESEERFRQITETIREVFWLSDASHAEMLYVSPAYELVWGRPREALYAMPMTWAEAIHPDDRPDVVRAIAQEQVRGEYDREYRVVRPDGSVRWVHDRAFPVRNEAGEVYRIAGVAEDITEQRHARGELQESERRLKDMLSNVHLLAMMLDRDARITYINEYMLTLTGWRHEDVAGRDAFEVFVVPDQVHLQEVFRALIAGHPEGMHEDSEILTRSGERRLIRWSNTVLRSAAGEVIGTASIGQDITEQQRAETKIRALNRVYAMQSGINALIVRVNDKQELFEGACRIAVEHGRFGLAWVGEFAPQTQTIVPVASAGESDHDFLMSPLLSIREHASESGNALVRAVRSGEPMIDNDIAARPAEGSERRREAIRRGYRSTIALPLTVEGAVVGTFAVFAKEAGFFDGEEAALLNELAGNIAFALNHIGQRYKLDKLSRVRAVSGEINAAIVRIRDREALLKETCRIADEHGKFPLVWIAEVDPASESVRPIAWKGFSDRAANAVSFASMIAVLGRRG